MSRSKKGLKRLKRMAAAAVALLGIAAGAAAQETEPMRLYVAEEGQSGAQAKQMLAALEDMDGRAWTLCAAGETLEQLVLADRAPDLAVCSPQEAAPWAAEGLLMPLQTRIPAQKRMAKPVVDSCMQDGMLYMAPLYARHRQIAVNAALFDRCNLGYMLDGEANPVWYPMQFQQIVEEFALAEMTALEIWPPESGEGAAVGALVQAIYGGVLTGEEGEPGLTDDARIEAGFVWLRDMIRSGMIAMADSREDALARFMAGESAMFIDWTKEEAQRQRGALEESGMEVRTAAYPSALGLPVRSYTLTGVCVFDSGDAKENGALLRAAQMLEAKAQPEDRAIWRDDTLWLPAGGDAAGMLFERALCAVLADGETPETALREARAAMEAQSAADAIHAADVSGAPDAEAGG